MQGRAKNDYMTVFRPAFFRQTLFRLQFFVRIFHLDIVSSCNSSSRIYTDGNILVAHLFVQTFFRQGIFMSADFFVSDQLFGHVYFLLNIFSYVHYFIRTPIPRTVNFGN